MKSIDIQGKKNINKIFCGEISKKIPPPGTTTEIQPYTPHQQLEMIRKLYMNTDFNEKSLVNKNLQKKWNGYKQQDIKNWQYNEFAYISKEQIITKLLESKLKCYYCKCSVCVLYSLPRDGFQWTLDRVDNTKPHTDENTIISCLSCNLQRRNIDKNKFLFTKNLSIVKTG